MLKEENIIFENIDKFRLLNEGVNTNVLVDAINKNEYLYLYYEGEGSRLIKPFTYGTYKINGEPVLRAWVESGSFSKSFWNKNGVKPREYHEKFTFDGKIQPGFRLFYLNKIKTLLPTGKRFNLKDEGGIPIKYNEHDKDMSSIYAAIPNNLNSTQVDGLESGIDADMEKQNVGGSIFDRQKSRFFDFSAAKSKNEITNNQLKDLYDLFKKVTKKNPRDYFVASSKDGQFKYLNNKYKLTTEPSAIVGNLHDLYVKKLAPNIPISTQWHDNLKKQKLDQLKQNNNTFEK